MDDYSKSVYINALLYTLCYDIDKKTPIVSKWMTQIRKGLRKIDPKDYNTIIIDTHNAWEKARHKVIPKGSKVDVKISELLMSLYNRIPGKYQNMYFTDKTFTRVTNSFESCLSNRADDMCYTESARELANAFLTEIGISPKNQLLARRIAIMKQNMIIEGKTVAI